MKHWTDPNGTDLRRFIVYDLMPRSLDLSGSPGFEFTEKLLKSVPFWTDPFLRLFYQNQLIKALLLLLLSSCNQHNDPPSNNTSDSDVISNKSTSFKNSAQGASSLAPNISDVDYVAPDIESMDGDELLTYIESPDLIDQQTFPYQNAVKEHAIRIILNNSTPESHLNISNKFTSLSIDPSRHDNFIRLILNHHINLLELSTSNASSQISQSEIDKITENINTSLYSQINNINSKLYPEIISNYVRLDKLNALNTEHKPQLTGNIIAILNNPRNFHTTPYRQQSRVAIASQGKIALYS